METLHARVGKDAVFVQRTPAGAMKVEKFLHEGFAVIALRADDFEVAVLRGATAVIIEFFVLARRDGLFERICQRENGTGNRGRWGAEFKERRTWRELHEVAVVPSRRVFDEPFFNGGEDPISVFGAAENIEVIRKSAAEEEQFAVAGFGVEIERREGDEVVVFKPCEDPKVLFRDKDVRERD